jgi:hypothetical protein
MCCQLTTAISQEILLALRCTQRASAGSQLVLWVLVCLLALYPMLDTSDQPLTVVPTSESFMFPYDEDNDGNTDDGVVRSVAAVVNTAVTITRSRSYTRASTSATIPVPPGSDSSAQTRGPPVRLPELWAMDDFPRALPSEPDGAFRRPHPFLHSDVDPVGSDESRAVILPVSRFILSILFLGCTGVSVASTRRQGEST